MELLAESPYLEKVLEPGFADKRLYAIYMCETYHYTKHNARNQALVATRHEDMNPRYMKYCLHHAEEEVGHELMAFHDLKKLGIDIKESELPDPLNSTRVLTAYLYYTAEKLNPVARLGYSYWAERVYEFMQPLLELMKDGVNIPKAAMSFFNEHSEIDEKHAQEVDRAIEMFIKTEKDAIDVEETMVTSLKLTSRMLDEVFEEFVKVKNGESTRYQFLEQLQ
jgi:pyrroloquinoline quinone (PQQ) biosynthesis protein C